MKLIYPKPDLNQTRLKPNQTVIEPKLNWSRTEIESKPNRSLTEKPKGISIGHQKLRPITNFKTKLMMEAHQHVFTFERGDDVSKNLLRREKNRSGHNPLRH